MPFQLYYNYCEKKILRDTISIQMETKHQMDFELWELMQKMLSIVK